MNSTDPELIQRLGTDLDAPFRGIVVVNGDPADRAAEAEAAGLTVHRVLAFARGLALSGPARGFLALNGRGWVVRIEEDRRVSTF